MLGLSNLDILFVSWAFLFQFALLVHFSLRKWHFNIAMRYGPTVYVLGILASVISAILLYAGKPWLLWVGGFIYLIWGIYGYWIEYVKGIQWRNPPRWGILVPYVFLYLATIMFYWWPLALISKPTWYVYAVLFIINTMLNVTSHKRAIKRRNEETNRFL